MGLADKFLAETERRGECGICLGERISKEAVAVIDAACGKRGSTQVMEWLQAQKDRRGQSLWPAGWTYGRIESHWKHEKRK